MGAGERVGEREKCGLEAWEGRAKVNREARRINSKSAQDRDSKDGQEGNSSWGGWKMKKEAGSCFESCRQIDFRGAGKSRMHGGFSCSRWHSQEEGRVHVHCVGKSPG